jgi:hypothetical protein
MGARAQHNYAYRKLRERLREWRLRAHLSQRELALRLKKPPSYVHKCEVGDRRIDPVEFIAWCRGCGRVPSRSLAELERHSQG